MQLGPLVAQIHKLSANPGTTARTDGQLLDDFTSQRDAGAFAVLVARHGPMVLRVCRRVLRHEQDAEDAFQATFLVLAQNARSIHKREALASWLHGVAYRIAMQARRSAARRRNHEAKLRGTAPVEVPGPTWDDVQAVLDEEVRTLAEPYRRTFVLCVLEGRSVPEAARELGCKEGTASSRLARARHTLRERLERRGIHLAALLAALSVAESSAQAVPGALTSIAIRFGLLIAAGESVAELIPSRVVALATGVTRAMFLTKAKFVTAAVLILSFVAFGANAWTRPPRLREVARASVAPPPVEAKESKGQVRGRVLDPDGKPVRGAKLVFLYPSPERAPEKVWAISSADGRFHFAPPPEIAAWDYTYVVAAANGHGFAWARVRPESAGDLTLRLVKDDVPLRGRVLDLEGRPVAGVTVRVDNELHVPIKGTLSEWLAAIEAGKQEHYGLSKPAFATLFSAALATLFPPVTTGPDGRFQITGIGPERVVSLHVQGPTIATQQLKAITRVATTLPPRRRADELTVAYHGVPFDFVAAPTKPVVGVVRDKDTGKPLAGVTVRSHRIGGANDLNGLVRGTTDKDGRYRLVGLPKSAGNAVVAEAYGRRDAGKGQPYLQAIRRVGDTPGFDPVTVDLPLQRGVWIEGRVIDKATGQGVRAGLEYLYAGNNPNAAAITHGGTTPEAWTRKDGSFRLVAVPGQAVLAVRADQDKYRMGVGVDDVKIARVSKDFLETSPFLLYPGNYHTLVEITPKPGDESITCDVFLDAGRTVQGAVLGPEGTPLPGARVSGQRPMGYWEGPLAKAEFTLWGLSPGETRPVRVVHDKRKLAGWLEVRGDEAGPVRVRLEPWGVVIGRVVNADGEPRTDVSVRIGGESTRVDKDGRFRMEGLAPGLKYDLTVLKGTANLLEVTSNNAKDLVVKPGETKELGDLRCGKKEE